MLLFAGLVGPPLASFTLDPGKAVVEIVCGQINLVAPIAIVALFVVIIALDTEGNYVLLFQLVSDQFVLVILLDIAEDVVAHFPILLQVLPLLQLFFRPFTN